MAKNIFTLADLGREGTWLLVQQACGIPDARARSSFLDHTTTVLFFAQDSLVERLSITAAVRQMGGYVVYVEPGQWVDEIARYPKELNAIAHSYVDIVYTYGLSLSLLVSAEQSQQPCLNGGCAEANPINALADIACMQQCTPDLAAITVGWVGCANGTLCSLVEALDYFPFHLRVALPKDGSPTPPSILAAAQSNNRLAMVDTPEEAVHNANYICAGCLGGTGTLPPPEWHINTQLLTRAADKVRILLSASPTWSTPIDRDLLRGKASLLSRQGENRLRVNKRILHLLWDK